MDSIDFNKNYSISLQSDISVLQCLWLYYRPEQICYL